MSQSRNITDFFGRLRRPGTNSGSSQQRPSNASDPSTAPVQSVPRTESSSSLAESTPSGYSDTPTDSPGNQLKESLLDSAEELPEEKRPYQSFQSARTAGDSSVGGSFNSSQRLVKDGKEIVTGTDGEDTDSVGSLEDVDDILRRFTHPKNEAPEEASFADTRMNLRSRNGATKSKSSLSKATVPDYKNTLEMLVTEAVDDNETEAGVAKAKAAMETENSRNRVEAKPGCKGGELHEDILTSALGDKDDELGLSRLLDAVRRTEAFEQEKSWLFFDHETDIPPVREFPRDAVAPGSHSSGLRDPDSRERMFHSGIIDFAFSKGSLPDELVTWIFHSVPSEPRDEMRKAYSGSFKHVTPERVGSLIHPEDVNDLFRRLGAGPKALSLSEAIIPDTSPKYKVAEDINVDRDALLSVFELLRDGAELFAGDTRTHALNILLRLTVDRSLMADIMICSGLERTLTALLESSPEDSAENMVYQISRSLYDTIKDTSFQSRLLIHILPTSDWIALLRCRLAVAFLTQSPAPLTEPPDAVLNLRRITDVLQEPRFDTKRHKHKPDEYDYGELSALTTLLDVAIEPGVPRNGFLSKAAEREYNVDVDLLAERIKMIFTSIQGLGASHLKRAMAKSALETLRYRILYSVRSRPPPKVSLFGDVNDVGGSGTTIDRWVTRNPEGDSMEDSSK